jgi:hypothetical protein
MTLQHLRSSTANKRPLPGSMSDGQIAINTNTSSPGLFFKDSAGALVKVGPVHVGSTAPNVSPAGGGETGNTVGEQWLDTSGSTYVFKVWDGSAWRSEAGEFVNASGDVMTGALGIIAGSAGSPGLYFSGDTNTGIYSPGADQVAISTNGTGRLFVDSSGNVGIGSASDPGAIGSRLWIDAASDTYYTINTTGSTNLAGIHFRNSNGNGEARILNNTGGALTFYRSPGNEAMRLDSSGRLGLGTSSPGRRLVIAGDTNTVCAIQGANNGTSSLFLGDTDAESIGAFTYNHVGNHLEVTVNAAERMRIDSSGRVGIGTATPQSLLDVNLGSSGVHATFGYVAGRGLELSIDAAASTGGAGVVYNAKGGGVSGTHIFQTDNNERCRLTADGKLLVGTSTARANFNNSTETSQLQVEGTTFDTSSISITRNLAAGAGIGGGIRLARSGGSSIGSNTTVASGDGLGYIEFSGADGTEFVRGAAISAEVDGTPGANDMPGRLVFSTTADGASSPTERMRIGQNGHVNIGQTASGLENNRSFSFQTTGAGQATFNHSTANANGDHWIIFGYNSTQIGSITQNGTTGTSYSTSSDYRLKENVVPLTEAVARVQQLKPSQFNFIADPDRTVDGFIAHEAQAVVPECVTGEKDAVDADGNPVYQGIDQSKLVPLLTAALQEALAEIESLKARLDTAGI